MNTDIIGRYLEGEPHRIKEPDKDATVFFDENLPYLNLKELVSKKQSNLVDKYIDSVV
jgi:hypothetical protein